MDKGKNYRIKLENTTNIKQIPKKILLFQKLPLETDADGIDKFALVTVFVPDTVHYPSMPKIGITLNVMGKKTTAYFASIVEADTFIQTLSQWWDSVAGKVGVAHNEAVSQWQTFQDLAKDAIAHRLEKQGYVSPEPKDTSK